MKKFNRRITTLYGLRAVQKRKQKDKPHEEKKRFPVLVKKNNILDTINLARPLSTIRTTQLKKTLLIISQ